MPASARFQHLALHFIDPVQHEYEVIRGIFVADETIADETIAARSWETALERLAHHREHWVAA
jgi:hypothetical protein